VIQEIFYFVEDKVITSMLTNKKKTVSNFYMLDLVWVMFLFLSTGFVYRYN